MKFLRREVKCVPLPLAQIPEPAVRLPHRTHSGVIVHRPGEDGADCHIERLCMAVLDSVDEALHLSHDGCWGQSGGHIICADVHDHQSLPGHPVEPPGVLLQAPPEESAGVDVSRRQVSNVLLNTPAHGGCEQYSILDGSFTRQALYA
ncbi:hypothetical protein F7725_022409 [Dissostichus mawsoni]|uniref:Uncharacterized protein n=1 Tax=Dissostichus mawsoni TaxID=36200 RepID=A0A7J5YXN6_DISMA|nr:hypothetical protein F7725_022409 [Dissostichus mawsoni]